MKILFSNRKAYYNYEVLQQYIAGLSLYGWEVKSIKSGCIDMSNAYIIDSNEELYIINSNISSDKSLLFYNHLASRKRKLLLNKKEIKHIIGFIKSRPGLTIVPLEVFINEKGLIKAKIGIVKGRKKYDKRELIKKRDFERELRSLY